MSEKQKETVVNDELTSRVSRAYYADDCSLFDWSGMAHLIIRGSNEAEESVDIIVPHNDLKSILEKLLPEVVEIEKGEKEKIEDEKW